MEPSFLLTGLNQAQQEAVSLSKRRHCLVLSGAGSGKTRVLAHRIAWLLQNQLASPFGVLAVTFTNKAAAEMRARVQTLVGLEASHIWLGTFHSICHRLLRIHHQEAGLPDTFQILDMDDQLRIIKRLMKEQQVDDKKWPARQVQHFIGVQKDAGRRSTALAEALDPYVAMMSRLYAAYEAVCQRTGVVDFSELLLRGYEIFQKQPQIKGYYQERFRHILVDEFQDTNSIQYAWLKQMAGPNTGLFVVGDDDQSIYGWRGARIENIQQFTSDFKDSCTIRLEQNYRSTQTILSAANAVIEHNENRLGKTLWTNGEEGKPIAVYAAFDEIDEARFLVGRIKAAIEQGHHMSDIAILYRSNAQSRLLEESMIHARIPYRIYGGLRFFDRSEVKDTLGYLRLLINRDDDSALERIINVPARGVGEKTLATMRDTARLFQCSLWKAAQRLLQGDSFTMRAQQAISQFLEWMNQLEKQINSLTLQDAVEQVIKKSGLIEFYLKEPGEKGQSRVENLEELVNAAGQFKQTGEDRQTPLMAFVSHAALESGEGQTVSEECVHLMTLHSAKGLEFPIVMMCGMEEGLFPHQLSSSDPAKLEEERRLCYVGMTRAMQALLMTHAEKRRLKGQENTRYPSRFIQEIPAKFTQEVRLKTVVSRVPSSYSMTISYPAKHKGVSHMARPHENGIQLGQKVKHPSFGNGIVLCCEGVGKQARVQVNFERGGAKWLMSSYAKLETIA